MTEPTTELMPVAKTGAAKSIVERAEHFAGVMPQTDRHAKQRFLQVAIAVANDRELLAKASVDSVVLAIYGAARLGLVPDKALGHVHIVPYKRVATLVIGYQGHLELARRSGELGSVYTGVVREGEEYRFWVDENGPHIVHTPNDDTEAKITHAYCIARVRGEPMIERMTIAEIEKRNTGSPVWRNWYTEQVRKTVLRRASKLWPLSPEMALAVRLDELAEANKSQANTIDDDRVIVQTVEPKIEDRALDALMQGSTPEDFPSVEAEDDDAEPVDETIAEDGDGIPEDEKRRIMEQERMEAEQADKELFEKGDIPY